MNIPSYLGGINEALDENLIKINEAKKAQNCDISRGNLKRIKGYLPYKNLSLSSSIGTMMKFYKNGVGTLLLCSNGNIYKAENGVLTLLKSGFTENRFDYLNFKTDKDILIFGNGKDNTQVYDGSTFRDLKHDGKNSAVNSSNKAPKCSMITLHYERVWAAGDSENPDRLYFSTANTNGFDPDDWTAPISEGEANQHGGFIDIPTFDGGKIVGLAVIFDDILVFKSNGDSKGSLFKIYGTYPGNYEKIQLFSSNGAIADKSIVSANNRAYFLNKDGIYIYDGTNVTLISDKINNFISTLNKDYLKYSVAYFYDNKYILAVPEGTSAKNNAIIEFNTKTNAFMIIRGIGVNSFIEFEDKLLFTNDSGKVYVYGTGDSFNGALITSYWETWINDLGTPEGLKDIEYVYFTGSGNGQVKISVITERNTKSSIVGLKEGTSIYRVKIKNKGRLLGFRIENVNGSYFNIENLKCIYDLDLD